MANTASAAKRDRQSKARSLRNRAYKTAVRASRKKVVKAIEAGDAEGARTAMVELASKADRAANARAIHRNAASRLKREYSRRVKAVATA